MGERYPGHGAGRGIDKIVLAFMSLLVYITNKEVSMPTKVPVYPVRECLRCGARWLSRTKTPVRCPRCQSLRWAVPRKERP